MRNRVKILLWGEHVSFVCKEYEKSHVMKQANFYEVEFKKIVWENKKNVRYNDVNLLWPVNVNIDVIRRPKIGWSERLSLV